MNSPKTWLLVKDTYLQFAHDLFRNSGIQITTKGRPFPGATLGNVSFSKIFITKQVVEWVTEMKMPSTIATTHAATCSIRSLSHGLSSKWLYLARASLGLEN